ncbi:hypothetical protein IJI99_02645, partial [bacterium]|nr:hypothetical protein [bacterium]
MKRKLWCLLVLILVGSVLVGQVLAIDPVDDLQHEIDELEKMKKMSEDATAPLEKEVKSLVSRINNAQARVKQIKVELQELASSIEE